MWPWGVVLRLDEFKVLPENLVSQTVKIDSLTHRLVHSRCGLLHFFVFGDQILLQLIHLSSEALDCFQLVVGLGLLNLVEYL